MIKSILPLQIALGVEAKHLNNDKFAQGRIKNKFEVLARCNFYSLQ
jgi:hypothetical protein